MAIGLMSLFNVVLPAGANPPGTDNFNKSKSITVTCNQPDDGDGTLEGHEGKAAGTLGFEGPTLLWPPNHKYVSVTLTVTDEDNFVSGDNTTDNQDQSDAVTMTVTGTDSNTLNGFTKGAGNDDPNIVLPTDGMASDPGGPAPAGDGSAQLTGNVQEERSGQDKAGRTYNVTVTAHFTDSDNDDSSDDGTDCQTTFHICVPHDMRKSYRDQLDDQKCPNPQDGSVVTGTSTA
jgi:hypothetical protein